MYLNAYQLIRIIINGKFIFQFTEVFIVERKMNKITEVLIKLFELAEARL